MKNHRKKSLRVYAISLITILITIPSTTSVEFIKNNSLNESFNGNIFYVGGIGSGNYSNIRDALRDANDGDTVYVFNGTYYEYFAISKSINLIGESKESTIINGSGTSYVVNVIKINADGVKVSGFTIDGGSFWTTGGTTGIEIHSNNNSIIGNIIYGNRFSGIRLTGFYYPCSNNTISGNVISNNYIGISFSESNDNYISNNKIFNHSQCGLSLFMSYRNEIQRNNIKENPKGIWVSFCSNNIFTQNNFIKNIDKNIKIVSRLSDRGNTWNENYWNKPLSHPKIIIGRTGVFFKFIPSIAIDWNPAQEPFNMGV